MIETQMFMSSKIVIKEAHEAFDLADFNGFF